MMERLRANLQDQGLCFYNNVNCTMHSWTSTFAVAATEAEKQKQK